MTTSFPAVESRTLIALVIFIISAQSSPNSWAQGLSYQTRPFGSGVYLFGVVGDRRPFNFEDEDGKLTGFDIDIVNSVCRAANKRCYVVLTTKEECIFTDRNIDYAGTGLMSDAIQGCVGYQITKDRQNEFLFSLPYLLNKASYSVRPGNPKNFDPGQDDFSAFKLVQSNGSPFNAACLRRQGKTFGTIFVAATVQEATKMILNGTADVLLSTRASIPGLDVLPQAVHCDDGHGTGIMLNRGSDVTSWWNKAFYKMYVSGAYGKLCQKAVETYGDKIHCLPPHKSDIENSFPFPDTDLQDISVSERLWKFVVSGRVAPYSFINKAGELVGFTKDFIMNVCKIARKQCTLMLAEVNECSVRVGELLYPGRGLLSGWFDACTGYYSTVDRRNSWDFTDPYLVSNASFYVLTGNPRRFNPQLDDLSAFTIVFQATAITTDHCLHRLHKQAGKLMVTDTAEEAQQAVLSGKADAWFTKLVLSENELERLPERFHCGHVGTSVMTRKGSELPVWWNKAYRKFLHSGQYHDFCRTQGKMYNNSFPCVPASAVPGLF